MAILSSLTAEEARVLVVAITSAPAIIGGIAALVVNIGTLIVVLFGKREIHQVKKIVNSRTDQLLEAVELKGEYKGMVKVLDEKGERK